MSFSSRQRQDDILAQVIENGQVTVKELAQRLQVCDATVRRDLRALADRNQVELIYGGATLPRHTDFSFQSKSQRNSDAKKAVGKLASQLVGEGEQLFIDSGTTCFEISHFLKRMGRLSIIVNSTRLAAELATNPSISVILLGGHYRPDRADSIGPLTISAMDQLRGYRAFIGADGLSMDFGVTAADIESAHLYRLAVRNARESILLVDHSKFLSPSLFKIVEWESISRVVTDQPPGDEWMTFFEERGIDTIYPSKTTVEGKSSEAKE